MVTEEDVKELIKEHVDSCKIDIHLQIQKISDELAEQKKIRKQMEETLEETLEQAKRNHKAFSEHDKDEMEKYDKVLDSIQELTDTMKKLMDETDANSMYVTEKQHQEEIDKRVAEALVDERKPNKEIWHKVKMTAFTVVTVGALGALGAAGYFILELYVRMGLDK